MITFEFILLVLSVGITIVFFAYGFNIYYMLKLSRKYKAPPCNVGNRPRIAIQVPIFNEKYVVPRLLSSCTATAARYGKDLVRISILDDSDDETTAIIEEEAQRYRDRGFNVEVRHRTDRTGFKAGALNEALNQTEEEFIVIFDSDFLPRPDYLERAAAYITADKSIGVVQFKWSYTNRKFNWMTKSVSIGMDAHFLIEQPARCDAGLFLNFNGSAGIIRVSALREAGGWQSDTLAEDLDASYRMQLNGSRIQFVLDDVPCEVTPTVASFKRQQGRWARGSLQVAKKSLGRILLSRDISVRKKFAATIHLTYYLVAPLMFFSFVLAAIAATYNIDSIKVTLPSVQQITSIGAGQGSAGSQFSIMEPLWVIFGASIVLCTIAAWVYYIVAMRRQHLSVLRNAKSLLVLGFLGYGICVSNTLEAMKAFLLRSSGSFKRTPKYAVMDSDGSWRDKKYQVPVDSTSAFEAASIVFAMFAIVRAVHFLNYGLVLILSIYCVAFLFVFLTTLFQSGKEKAQAASSPNESRDSRIVSPVPIISRAIDQNQKQ